jgi:hypothetical protein
VRTESGGYRRDYLRALAQRIEVDAKEVRIAVSSAKTAGFGVPSFVGWRARSMKMMGWTAPALRHQGAITWSSLSATMRGAVRFANYHDWSGYCEARFSSSRG